MDKIIVIILSIILLFGCSKKLTTLSTKDNIVFQGNQEFGAIPKDSNLIKFSCKISKLQFYPNIDEINFFELQLYNNQATNNDDFFHQGQQVKNIYKKFKNYTRQYSGYINYSNEKILIVKMLPIKKNKRNRRYYDEWKSRNYLFHISYPFEKRIIYGYTLEVNLSQKGKIKILDVSDIPKSNYSEVPCVIR